MSWNVTQFLFRKSFRQSTSNRWVEKWDNLFRKIIETNNLKQMSWKVRQFLFRKSFRQTTSNRWVPRGCAALDKRLRNDFVRGEIDLGWFVYVSTRHHFFFKENIHCAKRHLYLLYWQVQNQYKEIEHVKGCDCLDRPNNERFIYGSQVFVNYHHKKYILRLFPFSLWFCIAITNVI